MDETDSSYMYQLLGMAREYIQCMSWTGCIDYVGGRRHQLDIDNLDFTYYDCYHDNYQLMYGYAEVMDWIVNNASL